MKMNEEMKNCLLGLRMDITALRMQRNEYGNDMDLFTKQPHTLGTCQCYTTEYCHYDCELHDNYISDYTMYAVMEDEINRAEAILEDTLLAIWAEQNHVEAPDHIAWADDIELDNNPPITLDMICSDDSIFH